MEQDPQFKESIRQLGMAVNDSLSESEQVADILAQIREGGYDVLLILELTVGFSKRGKNSVVHRERINTQSEKTFEIRLTDEDSAFLKSLRIIANE